MVLNLVVIVNYFLVCAGQNLNTNYHVQLNQMLDNVFEQCSRRIVSTKPTRPPSDVYGHRPGTTPHLLQMPENLSVIESAPVTERIHSLDPNTFESLYGHCYDKRGRRKPCDSWRPHIMACFNKFFDLQRCHTFAIQFDCSNYTTSLQNCVQQNAADELKTCYSDEMSSFEENFTRPAVTFTCSSSILCCNAKKDEKLVKCIRMSEIGLVQVCIEHLYKDCIITNEYSGYTNINVIPVQDLNCDPYTASSNFKNYSYILAALFCTFIFLVLGVGIYYSIRLQKRNNTSAIHELRTSFDSQL